MSEPGRALLVQCVGRLLCWSLATGMVTAAADLVLDPQAAWWRSLWLLPWYLAVLSVLAWAVLRARQKAARRSDEEDVSPEHWERAA